MHSQYSTNLSPVPQQAEVDEPGSESYNEQMFKRRNNERMVTETFQNAREAGAYSVRGCLVDLDQSCLV